MDGSTVLRVRILGLGDAGSRAVPAVARAVRELWSSGGDVEVGAGGGTDDARGASLAVRRWSDRERVDVVLTVGRGGPGRGDYAPEMTAALLDRPLPGIEERMYLDAPRNPESLLFRGRAGMRRATLVVNLPERASRARHIVRFLGPVVRHAVEKARGSDRECAPPGGPR
jgi:molybdopterin biosynthesis enzyme MoaB